VGEGLDDGRPFPIYPASVNLDTALAPPVQPRGAGSLAFERAGAATVLRTARSTSPLRLLTPRNHGHAAWVFAATFGGGLVDGDTIRLDVTLAPGSAGLVGTQASTKVYRCPTGACRQDLVARVEAGALLVLVPDPVVCFAEARYEQTSAVDLAADASLVLVDTFTAGRSARGERWQFARYAARLAVTRDGAPLVHDALILDPAHGALAARFGRFEAIATIVLVGPLARSLRAHAIARAPAPARAAAVVEAVSPIGDDGALIRIAGASIEATSAAVRGYLADLGAILGDDPFARKW
jgi:urease accessory protein